LENKNFHNRLKALRKERRLNQTDIAKILDVSVQSASSYENIREPNITQLIKLAEFFNVSLDYLLGVTSVKGRPNEREVGETIINIHININLAEQEPQRGGARCQTES